MTEAISLADFASGVVSRFPKEPCHCRTDNMKDQHFTFSAESLPEPPPLLVAHDLVMAKTEHQYGDCIRIDVVHFYASGETFRQIVAVILAGLFHCKRWIGLDLKHEASAITRLEIDYGLAGKTYAWDYVTKPHRFTYHPEIPKRAPWDWKIDEWGLPRFNLEFARESSYHPINDRDKRDRVEISGRGDTLVLVAELLLNIGLSACDIKSEGESMPPDKSYILESFPGHYKVHKWSAEAQLHLAGSLSWPGDYPEL